jgi:hypothetical protein
MNENRLPSGGWLSHITGDWEPGHLEITADLLRQFGFHQNAIDVAADAAQDPDFYDWHTPCAHAQAGNDEEGRTIETPEQAQSNYLKWVGGKMEKLISATDMDVRSGLFFLGYVLHSIQDLATHKGITNAQHSYVSKLLGSQDDPDHIEENRQKAREYSNRFLEALRTRESESIKTLLSYKGRVLPWDKLIPGEKARLLGKEGWDLTPPAYIEFCDLYKKYEKIKEDYPISSTLWSTDQVFDMLLRSLR